MSDSSHQPDQNQTPKHGDGDGDEHENKNEDKNEDRDRDEDGDEHHPGSPDDDPLAMLDLMGEMFQHHQGASAATMAMFLTHEKKNISQILCEIRDAIQIHSRCLMKLNETLKEQLNQNHTSTQAPVQTQVQAQAQTRTISKRN